MKVPVMALFALIKMIISIINMKKIKNKKIHNNQFQNK